MPIPIKHPRFTSKNGQHTLEYMILLTLIMAGIIIGGPYAIRSWNAQMKGWEDSVMDSMTDPLAEAPPDSISIPGCTPLGWANQACGLGYTSPSGGSVSCIAQEMLQMRNYTPTDCYINNPYISISDIARCDVNDSNHCCGAWVTPSGCTPGDFGCPADSDCGPANGCLDGEYQRLHICDTGYIETECVADPGCSFVCGGPLSAFVPIPKATFCGDDTGMPGDRDYVVSSDCTPATYCEYNCDDPFVPRGGPPATYCDCPVGMIYGAPGYANQGTCGANSCFRGSCGPNECEICPGCVCSPGWISRGSCGIYEYDRRGCPVGQQ